MIVRLSACALRHVEHYEPVSFPVVADGDLADVSGLLASDLERGRIRSLTGPDGRQGLEAVESLPDEARYAIYATLVPWSRGAELDLLVDVGRGARPVTVWWSPDRHVAVAWSDAAVARVPRPAGTDVPAWAARIADRHGVSGFGGELPWTDVEVGDVALALARLSSAEVAVLAGVEFQRIPTSPRAPARELAFFDPTFEPPVLQFYDIAFRDDDLGFVGPVDAPLAAGAMTALHEFGHVLADAPLRRAYKTYVDAWDAGDLEAEKAAWQAYKALGGRGPVIDAWEAFRAGRKGPSSAGFADPHESFAEAFALWHLDPDALERALPGAGAWFASDAHVRAAGL